MPYGPRLRAAAATSSGGQCTQLYHPGHASVTSCSSMPRICRDMSTAHISHVHWKLKEAHQTVSSSLHHCRENLSSTHRAQRSRLDRAVSKRTPTPCIPSVDGIKQTRGALPVYAPGTQATISPTKIQKCPSQAWAAYLLFFTSLHCCWPPQRLDAPAACPMKSSEGPSQVL